MEPKRVRSILYFLSEIQPGESTGGGRVLKAHFERLDGMDIVYATPALMELGYRNNPLMRLVRRLKRTRFRDRALKWDYKLRSRISSRLLDLHLRAHKPDIILTVAHGPMAYLASRLAGKHNIPLAVIFHDWWPVIAERFRTLDNNFRQQLDDDFRRLYHHADLAFCISEGMRRELGDHPNAPVLYPMPMKLPQKVSQADSIEKPQKPLVMYTGDMGHAYGRMLRELFRTWKQTDCGFEMVYYGDYTDWEDQDIDAAKQAGVLRDSVPLDELFVRMQEASYLLVVASFEESVTQYTRTSFPSKIAHFAQVDRPIVGWGPEESVPVEYLKAIGMPIIEDSDTKTVIRRLAQTVEKSADFREPLQRAQRDFRQEKLQEIFTRNLQSIIPSKSTP